MRYRIRFSTEWDSDYICSEDKNQAQLIFNMAVDSKMFSYVSLEEAVEHYVMIKEWTEDNDPARETD